MRVQDRERAADAGDTKVAKVALHLEPADLRAENIDLGFKAFAQAQIACAHLEPPPGLLVEVQSPPDLDAPAVIQTDFAVMDVRVEFHLQFDIQLQLALFQLVELRSDISQLGLVVVAGDQADLLHGTGLQHCLAETHEVLDLVLQPDVRVFDDDGLRALRGVLSPEGQCHAPE